MGPSYSREAVNEFVKRVEMEGGEALLLALWPRMALAALRDDERVAPPGRFFAKWMDMDPWEKANAFHKLSALVNEKGKDAFQALVKKAREADAAAE